METPEPIVLYMDRAKALRRLNRRMLLFMLPMILLLFGTMFLFDRLAGGGTSIPFFPLAIVLEMAILYPLMRRQIIKQTKPMVTISPEGIHFESILQPVGLLRWDEIAEMRTYTFMYRFLGIVPKDMGAVAKRSGKGGFLLRLNDWSIRLFYKPFRIFVAPINIPEEYLPMTADALLSRISLWQTAYEERAEENKRRAASPMSWAGREAEQGEQLNQRHR